MGSLPDERRQDIRAHEIRSEFGLDVQGICQALAAAEATIERQRQALERIALTKFAGPASIDPVAILQEIARAALSEGDSTERCTFKVGGLRCYKRSGHEGFHEPQPLGTVGVDAVPRGDSK